MQDLNSLLLHIVYDFRPLPEQFLVQMI